MLKRPTKLKEIYGNVLAKKTVAGIMERGELPATVLFHGLRGCGKSTLGLILARHFTNDDCIITLNVADTGGKSDMQKVIQQAKAPVLFGNYKIFILNEFQGVASDKAQEAMLEILEEPPPHTRFILTSTDPKKFKTTILSRCVKIPVSPLSISEFRMFIKKKKGILSFKLSEEFLLDLFMLTEGCPRDILMAFETVRECESSKEARALLDKMPTVRQRKNVFDLIGCILTREPAKKLMSILKQTLPDIMENPEKFRIIAQRALVKELLNPEMVPFYDKGIHRVLSPLIGRIFICEADVVHAFLSIRAEIERISNC